MPNETLCRTAHCTLIAALTFYRDSGMGNPYARTEELHSIATDDGNEISLSEEGVEDLLNRLEGKEIQLVGPAPGS